MKIVDAFWEKRNLGVTTTEFTIENDDTIANVEEVIKSCESQYQVLRLPAHMTEQIFEIQKLGFTYVEDMLRLKNNLNPIQMNPIAQRLHDAVTIERMNDEDFADLKNEIKKGMFNSDRVYIDPYFDNSIAAQRYANWITDEKEKGALFFKYLYKGNTVSFNALKELGNGLYDDFLGGVYIDYQKSGFGASLLVADIVRMLKGKVVFTNVSSNNTKQVKNLLCNGFFVETIYHVFIKHI